MFKIVKKLVRNCLKIVQNVPKVIKIGQKCFKFIENYKKQTKTGQKYLENQSIIAKNVGNYLKYLVQKRAKNYQNSFQKYSQFLENYLKSA